MPRPRRTPSVTAPESNPRQLRPLGNGRPIDGSHREDRDPPREFHPVEPSRLPATRPGPEPSPTAPEPEAPAPLGRGEHPHPSEAHLGDPVAPRGHRGGWWPAPEDGYHQVRDLVVAGGPAMVFQPQLSLSRLEVAGYEALARFPDHALHSPERWFALAHDVGLGAALETSAIANALGGDVARPPGTTLAVNLSPSVLGSSLLRSVLPGDLTGIELELTEHEVVLDPRGLRRELDLLRAAGARLAVDDVGAGHSGLRRIMELAPDSLKLDRQLVDGVADNTAKAALIRAVVDFADHIGATVCAEGVESVADLLALADLDVGFAQGWAIGTPQPSCRDVDPLVLAACRRSLRRVLTSSCPQRCDPEECPATLEDLLGRLADVNALDDLARVAHDASAVLACSRIELSYLRDGGTAVQPVDQCRRPGARVSRLADHPSTRHCLDQRVVVPIYAEAESLEGRLLRRAGMASALLVPVSSRGRPVGLLECFLAEPTPWARRQIRSARLLASVLGPVLDGLLDRP